jgi:hypothetical protein
MRKQVFGNMLVSIFAAAAACGAAHNAAADEDCCTPAITAKIAATLGFVDIAGIKLGMPAQEALNLIKADNAAFKTQVQNRDVDMQFATTRVRSTGPKKQWAFTIESTTNLSDASGGESITADLTLPPTTQVVDYVSRALTFATNATPTVDNLVASLTKKYGAPTIAQQGPKLRWIFDSQGQLLDDARMKKLGQLWLCDVVNATPAIDPPSSGYRGRQSVADPVCEKTGVTVVKAEITPTTTGGNMAGTLTVSMASIALLYNGVNATNVALDDLLKKNEEKQRQDADKLPAPKL